MAENLATDGSRLHGAKAGIQTLASPLPRVKMTEILAHLAHRGHMAMLEWEPAVHDR